MDGTVTAGALLERFAAAIAAHDWAGLRAVLDDEAEVTLLHTGERLDADGFVAFNRDYPGAWVYARDDVVDAGDRAVLRSHTELDGDTYHCATLATASSGRLTTLVEVWTEAARPHPERGTT